MSGSHPGLAEGSVVIVTGAARGTGAATAELFVAEGASAVYLVDLRVEEGRSVAERLGPTAHFVELDVTDPAAWEGVRADVVDRCGRIDVLVNNAAVLHLGTVEHTTVDQLRRVLDVNVAGTFAGVQAVVPAMRAQGGGAIVNVASVDALQGMNGVSAYAASKWAVRGLTKNAAIELGQYGIRVNSVHPGGMYTAMGGSDRQTEEELNATVYRQFPIPRVGHPEEVAQVQGHLRGCDWCERFGSQMGEVVGKLRRELATPPDAGPDVARRLMERLDLD